MSRCATCDRKLYPSDLKYAYHETDDGNHRIGGFITKLRRIDGALSHSCLQCYHQAFEDVCFLFATVVDIFSYSWILLNFTVRIDIFLLSNFPPWNLPENFNFDYFIPHCFFAYSIRGTIQSAMSRPFLLLQFCQSTSNQWH